MMKLIAQETWSTCFAGYVTLTFLLHQYGEAVSGNRSDQCPQQCRCNATTVDCSGQSLLEVPKNIPHATKSLLLCNNRITQIGLGGFVQLHYLENLDLSGNMIHALYKNSFLGLQNLKTLSLEHNLLTNNDSYPNGVFQSLRNLKILKLRGNVNYSQGDYSYYPDHVLKEVPDLKELYIDGIPNQPLGPGFSHLRNLEVLHLGNDYAGYCYIGTLPLDMFKTVENNSISRLELSFCNITHVEPGAFSLLRNLTHLTLTSNRYLCSDGFRNVTFGMNSTNIQSILGNAICKKTDQDIPVFTLPENAFEYLTTTALTHLEISDSALSSVAHHAILKLPRSLQYLSFRNNFLESAKFLEHVAKLTNLRTLDISFQLQFSTISVPTLKENVLKDRSVSKILNNTSESFETLQSNTVTRLFSNTVDQRHHTNNEFLTYSIRDWFQSQRAPTSPVFVNVPESLQTALGSNLKLGLPIVSLNFSMNVIEIIDVSANLLPCVLGKLYGLQKLQIFNLSFNVIQFIHPESFSDMPNLVELLLGNNNFGKTVMLDKVGQTFSNLTRLRKLDLSSNWIRELPASIFNKQKNLRILLLQNNSMNGIRFQIDGMHHLEVLDLSNNVIETISEEQTEILDILARRNSLTLNLAGNKLRCDCQNLKFLKWIQKTKVKFQLKNLTSCIQANGTALSISYIDDILELLEPNCDLLIVLESCIAGFVGLLLLLSLLAVLYHKRWKLRYLYFMGRRNINPYHPLMNSYVDVKHDIYISYDRDFMMTEVKSLHDFVTQQLYPYLRNRGFRVLIREELDAGKMLHDVISVAIRESAKVLALITSDFIKDFWNTFEVNMAAYEGIYTKRKVVIPVVFGEVKSSDFTPEILELLRAEPVAQFPTDQDEHTIFQAIEQQVRSYNVKFH